MIFAKKYFERYCVDNAKDKLERDTVVCYVIKIYEA